MERLAVREEGLMRVRRRGRIVVLRREIMAIFILVCWRDFSFVLWVVSLLGDIGSRRLSVAWVG